MNILIVPSSTEVAHEIVRSLQSVKNIELFGANSIDAYSELPSKNNFIGIPYINDDSFISEISDIIKQCGITHVFPAHDAAALKLSKFVEELNVKVVSSSYETNSICRSKKLTYQALSGIIRTPRLYDPTSPELQLPLFSKPDIGQGSVGTFTVETQADVVKVSSSDLLCELLPGDEYTVDCISDAKGNLIHSSARQRNSMRNGIAVESQLVSNQEIFRGIASKINGKLNLKGAWFFQVKETKDGELCLLEVATRIAGSMITSRFNGINYAELSLLISEDVPVIAIDNKLDVTLYRNLSYQFKTSLSYDTIYSDFDDCLIFGDKVNEDLAKLYFSAINEGKKIVLITRHAGNLKKKLDSLRLQNFFDEIIHITDGTPKSEFIKCKNAIFIDDAFSERLDVHNNCKIPCFSVDMIKGLTCLQN
ncbi:ATP-grasp domain-containing protein [Vibrio breoganii]|uniref:ATP-grasp domain-containing protein n=1 Tax=Vibrio breoganii TaxID=553239 RepID=UPI0021C43D70|nr:ATP-grasp domain-containing protein [Vibrio breoganii]MDN3715957.1 ATP-grasp domain-containing protein [Vibrio breoganii]